MEIKPGKYRAKANRHHRLYVLTRAGNWLMVQRPEQTPTVMHTGEFMKRFEAMPQKVEVTNVDS